MIKNSAKYWALLLITVVVSGQAMAQYRTEAFRKTIQTVQVSHSDGIYALPVLTLNSNEQLTLSFDELTAETNNYYYTIKHCNADWALSDATPIDWCKGFPDNAINDVYPSLGTTVNYMHYSFSLPNNDLNFKYSGNYVALIHEANNPDNILATICFSVVEQKVGINAAVKTNTDIETNGRYQQIDFSILNNNYPIQDPNNELKVFVQQNRRTDNEAQNIQPAYITSTKLTYTNNKALVFEGGNEYKAFEATSLYSLGQGVNRIRYSAPYYVAELFADKIEPRLPYRFLKDANGRFVVNALSYDDDNVTADYMLVNFTLEADAPFFDGLVYILGDFNHNRLNNTVKMDYSSERKCYEKAVLLKQGGYNYQYIFVPAGAKKGTAFRVSGSYWQTENQYAIYVYHRPFGERYDRLVGVRILQSGK